MKTRDVIRFFGILVLFAVLDLISAAFTGNRPDAFDETGNLVIAAMVVIVWAIREDHAHD